MARPRSFDETAALDAAIERFWEDGYAATSIRDLADGMRIGGASLYNAFSDKRTLFRAALQRYLDREARQRIAKLESEQDPVEGLRRFFADLVAGAAVSDRGCLLVNSAMEVAPHDDILAGEIRAGLGEIESGFQRAVAAGRRQGAILPSIAPLDASRLLLAAVIGILVLSRAAADKSTMNGIAQTALRAVIGPDDGRKLRHRQPRRVGKRTPPH